MGLFKVLGLLKTLLLLSAIGVITPFIEASSDGNAARKLHLTTTVMEDNDITSSSYPSPSPPPSPPPSPADERSNMSSFKPNIAVVVAVLTTVFSITFLLLLYAKHCKGGRNGYYSASSRGRAPPSTARKNSGVDRTVIESLPIFRFGSLRGEKDGLECAVCLNRFESTEVLRLLPKCKHAFHVECVDTWLDAHSTCPLCRYRVDPEDILLLADFAKILAPNEPLPPPPPQTTPLGGEENERLESIRRVSGRHSSAGERGSSSSSSGGSLQIVLHRPSDSSRRSLDSWNMRKKKKKPEIVSVGCFDRQCRKDGLLLTSQEDRRRLEHRIIIGGDGGGGFYRRWSDLQASDLLYLRSEMVMSDSRRLSASSSGSRPSESRHQQQNHPQQQQNNEWQSSRSVINGRSVSEITGLSRFGNTNDNGHRQRRQNHQEWRWTWRRREAEGEAGVVSRWMGWISQSQSHSHSETQLTQPHVRS
ncbi:RING-H2 finger protein ATL43-like [Camellia sinensis]|uniref:RING-type E3 ubiquitin transferase n=1 Tax=Camellia sinensis var. sinensis TaxID=542762 RepID=A0A4S4ESN2_CAMSN|nr:RING-H2 finger protein ATL43-like [Camellia sinensis]THG19405.1 hypothetical protein TEA_025790 [Camellia sinensis var. sinensis]